MKKVMYRWLFLSIGYLSLNTSALLAQDLAQATALSTSGQYGQAERIFQDILNQQPANAAATLAHAFNLSWMGHYKEAIESFKKALDLGANQEEATIGMAYAYAWSHKYALARSAFSQVLRKNQDNLNAKKGIAFSYLWQGNPQAALHYFDEIISKHPQQYDLFIGKGMAHLQSKDNEAAETAFKRALELSPGSAEAIQLIETAQRAPNLIEVDIWGGYSWLGDKEQKLGLRGLQLSAQLAKQWRGFAKYDNSLALDILNFARRDKAAPTVAMGAVHEWNKNLISELEYGIRFLDKDQYQHLVSGGQVYFLPQGIRLKVGAYAGFGQNTNTEWMTYFSLNLPLLENLHIEPVYYFVQPPASNTSEHRIQLGAQYRPATAFEINASGFYGTSSLNENGKRPTLYGWSLTGLAPIHRLLWGQLVLRQEKGVYYDFTSVALGIKVRVDKLVR